MGVHFVTLDSHTAQLYLFLFLYCLLIKVKVLHSKVWRHLDNREKIDLRLTNYVLFLFSETANPLVDDPKLILQIEALRSNILRQFPTDFLHG